LTSLDWSWKADEIEQTKKGKVKSQLALSHSPFSNGKFPNFIEEMETNK
jgi:hypothetical protein